MPFPRLQAPASLCSRPQLRREDRPAGVERSPPAHPPPPAMDHQRQTPASQSGAAPCHRAKRPPATLCPRKVSRTVIPAAFISCLRMNFCLLDKAFEICSSGKLITSWSSLLLKLFNVYKRALSASSGFFVFTVSFPSRPCDMRNAHGTLGGRLTLISKVCERSTGLSDPRRPRAPT